MVETYLKKNVHQMDRLFFRIFKGNVKFMSLVVGMTYMGLKDCLKDRLLNDELKRAIRIAKIDLVNAVNETWSIDYKVHFIKVTFKLKQEELFIDGVGVDKIVRKTFLSHVMPFTKLSGALVSKDGTISFRISCPNALSYS